MSEIQTRSRYTFADRSVARNVRSIGGYTAIEGHGQCLD